MERKRVFLYVRVSTEEQAIHGLSIEAQQTALEAWAKAVGYKVIGTYVDAGISARKPASKRPALQQLLNDVRAGKGDMVVFTKLDRWFRSVGQYYQVQDVLEKYGVSWRAIHEEYETTTASGRLKVNIMLSVAQDEADRTSERIKAINEMKRQKLEALTGESPFGYKIVDKKFVKDPETEEVVSSFFERFLATGSMIAARTYILENYGVKMQYQKAHKILKMPCYYGHYFGVDGMTPAYITKDNFEKIQDMRRKIVRKTVKNRVYLFSGIIVCGECGERVCGRVNTVQETKFYNCTSHYIKQNECKNNANISEKKIEKFIIEHINEKLEQLKVGFEKVRLNRKERDYKSEIAAIQSKDKRLKDLYVNDLITLDTYKKDHEEYTQKVAALLEESKNEKAPDFEKIEKLISGDWQSVYFSLSTEKKQEFWRILIKQIRIYHDRHIEFDLAI